MGPVYHLYAVSDSFRSLLYTSPMAKIVIDGRELSTSTGRYVERLLYHLQQIDSKHDYVVLLKPADLTSWRPVNPRFQAVVCPYKEFSFGEQLGMLRQLHGLQPDLVHFPMAQQPVLYRGRVVTTMNDLTTARFSNPSKNPVVFWVKQRIYRWLNRRVARKSAAIITYSDFVRRDIMDFTGAPASKFTVTPLAADPVEGEPQAVAGLEGARFLLYVGRPAPHKNLGRLIEAFAQLQAADTELQLVLAGRKDANYELHEKDVIAKGVQNVVFTDFIEDSQLRWLYENCTAYVFPSLSEGFGLPGLEAMRCGAPVVSSSATCLPEVYGDAAHYFDPLSIDDMVRAIREVITDDGLRSELIHRGKAQVEKYSWQRTAERTLEVYERVLEI